MNLDLRYFHTVQNTLGIHDEPTYKAANAQDMLAEEFPSSINYIVNAKRNDVLQPMIITGTEVKYKYNITTMPGDELYPGDIIEANGEHYIVVQTRSESPVYILGLAWLCNVKFRFQNWSPTIIERYGVLDSGVYSTTTGTDGIITYLKRQFKIYMPSDEDTDKIFIDKRLAVGTMYDQNGNEILEAYVVTGRTKFGKGGYGEGAHLLEMNAKSSEEVHDKDNVELMICDYIAPDESTEPDDSDAILECTIKGRNNIRLGSTRVYSGVFYDADGNECSVSNPVWTIEAPDGVVYEVEGTKCTITVPDDDKFSGAEVVLRLGDGNVDYKNTAMLVGVF